MRRTVLVPLLVLALLAAGIAWYLRRGPSGPGAEAPAARDGSGASSPAATATRGEGAKPPSAAGSSSARREARAKRDALREQIARQLASRSSAAAGPPAPATPPRSPTDPQPPGNLRDNLGGRAALVERLNRDFMPLASECIEQAQARTPHLAGMLAIGLETLADEQLGAVVEVADPTLGSQFTDPLLLECIRESAFSLSLPPPPGSGREKFAITIPIEPGSDAGPPR